MGLFMVTVSKALGGNKPSPLTMLSGSSQWGILDGYWRVINRYYESLDEGS